MYQNSSFEYSVDPGHSYIPTFRLTNLSLRFIIPHILAVEPPNLCPPMSTYVHLCPPMSTYVHQVFPGLPNNKTREAWEHPPRSTIAELVLKISHLWTPKCLSLSSHSQLTVNWWHLRWKTSNIPGKVSTKGKVHGTRVLPVSLSHVYVPVMSARYFLVSHVSPTPCLSYTCHSLFHARSTIFP